jgi:WD40 repeat protein
VVLTRDDANLVTSSADQTLILWDIDTGNPIRIYSGHADWVNDVDIAPDGNTMLSSSDDFTLILWDINSGEALRRFQGHTDWVETVDFASDGITAVSGSSDEDMRVWQIWMTDDEVREFALNTFEIEEVTCEERVQYRLPENPGVCSE